VSATTKSRSFTPTLTVSMVLLNEQLPRYIDDVRLVSTSRGSSTVKLL